MGTFHEDTHELHGITVVVETGGRKTYIGRCHDMDDERVTLLDVDEHVEGQNDASKADFIARAARVGVWPKHAHLVVPMADVTAVRRLGDLAG